MNTNYVKLFSKLIDWEWFQKSEMVHLLIYFLLMASKKERYLQGIQLQKGDVLTKLETIARDTNLSIRTIRTCISRLKNSNVIKVKTTNKYHIVTICLFDYYQDAFFCFDKQPTNNQQTNDKELTNNQQANNNQLTDESQSNDTHSTLYNKENKEIKVNNEKKVRKSKKETPLTPDKTKFLDSLFFSQSEYEKLEKKFGDDLPRMLEKLNNQKMKKTADLSEAKKLKEWQKESDFWVIQGWVKEWLEKQKQDEKKAPFSVSGAGGAQNDPFKAPEQEKPKPISTELTPDMQAKIDTVLKNLNRN